MIPAAIIAAATAGISATARTKRPAFSKASFIAKSAKNQTKSATPNTMRRPPAF
jgi:hypothetical protein